MQLGLPASERNHWNSGGGWHHWNSASERNHWNSARKWNRWNSASERNYWNFARKCNHCKSASAVHLFCFFGGMKTVQRSDRLLHALVHSRRRLADSSHFDHRRPLPSEPATTDHQSATDKHITPTAAHFDHVRKLAGAGDTGFGVVRRDG